MHTSEMEDLKRQCQSAFEWRDTIARDIAVTEHKHHEFVEALRSRHEGEVLERLEREAYDRLRNSLQPLHNELEHINGALVDILAMTLPKPFLIPADSALAQVLMTGEPS